MRLHELNAPAGSKKARKRRGRGTATGQGKTGDFSAPEMMNTFLSFGFLIRGCRSL